MAPHRTRLRTSRRNPNQIAASAKARGYKRGEHREQDRQTGLRKYEPKTEEANETALHLYASWRFDEAEDEYKQALEDGLTDAEPPDFDTVRERALRKNAPIPSIEDTKDFIRFVLLLSKGVLSEHLSAASLRTFAENFYRAFWAKTQTKIKRAHKKEIYYWIWHYLPSIGEIEKISKPKHNLGIRDMDRVLVALWDKLPLVHERLRVQVHFVFLLVISAGPRIGALFKNGVRYKDIQLVLTRREDGSYGWYWKWDQRHVKNNRNPDHFGLGIAGADHPILRYNNAAFLLPLAIADNALFGFNTLDDLWKQQIPEGDTEISLYWNDDVLDLPIVRAIGRDGRVSTSRLSDSTFRWIFRMALAVAGYVGVRPSLHQIRRQVGKEVDMSYPDAQRSQFLGQKDLNVYGREYVANCTSVDGRSAYLRETLNHKPNEFFQGLEMFHENGVPNRLPYARRLQVEKDISREVSEAERPEARNLSSLRYKSTQTALESYRKEWLEARRKEKILTRGKLSSMENVPSLELTDPNPEREKIAALVHGKTALEQAEMRQAIGSLYILCARDATVRYYRGEEPVNELCRFCSTPMSSVRGSKSSHAHMCRKKTLAKDWGVMQSRIRFCYLCAEWLVEGHRWESHCRSHLEQPFVRCGSIEIRRTLIRPAYCPFHLVSDRNPSERMRSWSRDADAIKHIKDEEVRNTYPTYCCNELWMTETDFDCHLVDTHGFHIKVHATSSPEPKDEMDEGEFDGFAEDTFSLPSQTDVATKECRERSSSSTPLDAILPAMTLQDASSVDLLSFGPANPPSFDSDWSEPVSQPSLTGSMAQAPSPDLVRSGEPPDYMWNYILPSPRLSPLSGTPMLAPSGDSDDSARQSPNALHTLPCSSHTNPEPMMLDGNFSKGSPPLQLCLDRSPNTGTLGLSPFRLSGGTPNSPIDLVSPKEISRSQGRDSRLAERKGIPPPHRVISKTAGPKVQDSPAGSPKQSRKQRDTAPRGRMDDRANPLKRRIILKRSAPKTQRTALPRRIVFKVKG